MRDLDGRLMSTREVAETLGCSTRNVFRLMDAGRLTPVRLSRLPSRGSSSRPMLRYGFGSLLIDVGESTARVSRLMGHANEAITGAIYTHEIERRDNAERTRKDARRVRVWSTGRERDGRGTASRALEATEHPLSGAMGRVARVLEGRSHLRDVEMLDHVAT